MASSHLSLRRWFNWYNKKYFANSLPHDTRLLWSVQNSTHAYMVDKSIHMDPMLAAYPRYMRIVLLHEMAHADLPDYIGNKDMDAEHGPLHQARIVELFKAGAYDGLL